MVLKYWNNVIQQGFSRALGSIEKWSDKHTRLVERREPYCAVHKYQKQYSKNNRGTTHGNHSYYIDVHAHIKQNGRLHTIGWQCHAYHKMLAITPGLLPLISCKPPHNVPIRHYCCRREINYEPPHPFPCELQWVAMTYLIEEQQMRILLLQIVLQDLILDGERLRKR